MRLSAALLRVIIALALVVGVLVAVIIAAGSRHEPEPYAFSERPTSNAVPPLTTTAARPSGLPFIDGQPPKIEVPSGSPQPIATRYGWTYTIPADWANLAGSVGGWSDRMGEIVRYGALGKFGRGHCAESDASQLAMTGAGGRNGLDLESAGWAEIRNVERIYADEDGTAPTVRYEGPTEFTVEGERALRFRAYITDIPNDGGCVPPAVTFDVVTLKGLATAEIMVLIVESQREVPGALATTIPDQIIGTIERTR